MFRDTLVVVINNTGDTSVTIEVDGQRIDEFDARNLRSLDT